MGAQLARLRPTKLGTANERLSTLCAAVSAWDPASDGAPPAVTRADIAGLEESLRPATLDQILDAVQATMMVFDPPRGDPLAHAAACAEVMEGMPFDVVKAALKRVRAECTFTPKPAEIRARAAEIMGERKRLVDKARVAAAMAERRRVSEPTRPATDEERQRVAELVSGLTVRPQVNPLLEAGPDRPETDDVNALRRVAAQAGVFRLPDIDHPEVQRWLRSA